MMVFSVLAIAVIAPPDRRWPIGLLAHARKRSFFGERRFPFLFREFAALEISPGHRRRHHSTVTSIGGAYIIRNAQPSRL